MIAAHQPPAVVVPTQVKYAISVFGNPDALTAIKQGVDRQGAVTSWATIDRDKKKFVLFIAAVGPKPTADEQAFIDDVNHKKFGDAAAGFAAFGAVK